MTAPPTDAFQRTIDYLRLSITDRCNLRCTYCVPPGGFTPLDHAEILRYEEILRVARVVVGMGIGKIRLTGGEPLVRKDILYLCEQIAAIPGLTSFSMTTNGVLLSRFARGLAAAGVQRVNVSLDTLDPARFARITRQDHFKEVWAGIQAALEAGFHPVKLNVVVMGGINDDEIEDLARLTFDTPFHVRFIEHMPFPFGDAREADVVPTEEILARLARVAPLEPARSRFSNGPARHFRFEGAKGLIGVISPVSQHFCPSCNRLRLTADGKLRACLFSSEETDLKGILRAGATDTEIVATIRDAIRRKPEKHNLDSVAFRKCISRPMVAIGG